MDDELTVEPSQEEDVRSPGELLSQGRERKGLSEEEVAAELNLSTAQIRALEQNRFGDLPGKTYVRGYLKSYARLVGCDESEVFRNFNLQEDASIRGIKPVFKESGEGGRFLRKLLFLAVIVALVGLGLLGWQKWEQLGVVSTSDDDQVRQVGGSTYQGPDPIEVGTDPSLRAAASAPTPEEAIANQQEEELRARIEAEELSRTREQRAEAVDPAMPQSGKAREVRMEFSASSWVDLRDSDGKRLVYEHVGQGRQIEVEGKPPFSVFLGNAEGVRIEYGGTPFDFSAFTNGVYARFTLGADGQ